MKREKLLTQEQIDQSLKFWFKGEQGRLVDEISGSEITPNGSSYFSWDEEHQAYKVLSKKYSYSAYCHPVDLGTNQWEHTVYSEVFPISAGSEPTLITLDTYPTRQAWSGAIYSKLNLNLWNKLAMVYTICPNNIVQRRGYVNGIIDIAFDYNSDGSGFNKGTGITINCSPPSGSTFANYYLKNLRFYNRPLTLDEIAAI